MAQIITNNNWWWGWGWGWEGDMKKSVYDPQNIAADAFDYDNFTNTPTIPTDNAQLSNWAWYITGITSWDVTLALGYTPYNSTNPSGYVTSSIINDTAYGSWWDWDTTHAPTKNAMYDKIDSMDTSIWNKANKSDVLEKTNTTSFTPSNDYNPATKKYVDDAVSDLMWLGKFLSLWDCTTWQPISFPLDTPYTYTTWDYFIVETVSSATPPVNYKPNWSSYTWAASSTTETDELAVWDVYIYDGSVWLLQLNHGKNVSFSEIAWSPSDNTALSNALNAKQDSLTLPATPTQWHLVTWGADNETLADGWAIPTWVPSWWTDWQVLSKVSGNIAWANPSWWDVVVSSQSWNILTSWTKIWAWTEANYQSLWTYDSNCIYLTI